MRINITTGRRRLIIRLSLIVLWIFLGVLLFIFYRGHTILVDNHNVAEPELRAPDLITVTMDNKKSMEFFRGDRDLFKMSGSRHLIRIDFTDGTPPFETVFQLPLRPDVFILSIPKMINGIEPFFEVFHSQQESRSDNEAQTDELPDTDIIEE